MSEPKDIPWTLGRAMHAHTIEDASAGRLIPGESCAECPPPSGPRLRVSKIDHEAKSITFTVDERRGKK